MLTKLTFLMILPLYDIRKLTKTIFIYFMLISVINLIYYFSYLFINIPMLFSSLQAGIVTIISIPPAKKIIYLNIY